jgi:hypothetical protein
VAARTEVLSWISGGADSGGCVPTNQMQCGTTAPCSLPPVGTPMGQWRCGQRWDSGGTDRGAELDQWRCGPWRKYHVMHIIIIIRKHATTIDNLPARILLDNYIQPIYPSACVRKRDWECVCGCVSACVCYRMGVRVDRMSIGWVRACVTGWV